MRRPFDRELSRLLDGAILRMEATRGWRRWLWRVVKWAYELGDRMIDLDAIAAHLHADAARWPDRQGDYHADCPYCGKPAKKAQVHFRIAATGLCYCQVCQAGTTVTALAQHLGVTTKPSQNGASPQTIYDYYDEAGVLAYQVVRYVKNHKKAFFQRHPDPAGNWVNGMTGVERVLYRLPEVLTAIAKDEPIYVVEGEKDVETLRLRGLVATTNVGGAGKWNDAYSQALKGATVFILPDNDQPGEEHAQQVKQSLRDVAKSARIVRLPELADKEDVSDWIAAGHTVEELRAICTPTAKTEYTVKRQGITLAELQYKVFDPEKWIIENIMPEGACLFAAKYKSKKSWLALAISLAIAMGGRALGRLNVAPGGVLYLDLEGKQQRIQKRTRAMLGVNQVAWPGNFHIFTKWSQGDEGLAELEQWLIDHPDTALIVIDVLASFRRPMQKHEEFYRYDRDTVDPINELAERYTVAILLVHHFNKGKHDDVMDSITGSTGLPSAVNTMWGLRRDVNDPSIQILELRGRDLENEDPLALKWDFYLNQHVIEGPASEVAISAERRAVLRMMSDDEPRTPKEIAVLIERPVTAVQQLLRKLLNEGSIDKAGYGKYVVVPKPDQTDQTDQSSQTDQTDHSDRKVPTLIGGDGTDQSLFDRSQSIQTTNSDHSDRYYKGNAENRIDVLLTDIPKDIRRTTGMMIISPLERNQEPARQRCATYGLDFEITRKALLAIIEEERHHGNNAA